MAISWISMARTAGARSRRAKPGRGLMPCPGSECDPADRRSRGQRVQALGLLGLAGTRRHVAQAADVAAVQVHAVDHEFALAFAARRQFQNLAAEEADQGP